MYFPISGKGVIVLGMVKFEFWLLSVLGHSIQCLLNIYLVFIVILDPHALTEPIV